MSQIQETTNFSELARRAGKSFLPPAERPISRVCGTPEPQGIAVKYLAALCLATQLVIVSGCAAISATVGHSEPNPNRIQVGETRDHAEDVLGKRLWRAGSADGLTYDIYEYEVERPADPIKGAVLLVADVFVFGLPEILSLSPTSENFADVHQLAVAYDEQDRVRFVSKRWPVMRTFDPCRRMRSLLPDKSGVPSTARPSQMDLPAGAVSGVATLELEWPGLFGSYPTVDGHKAEGRVVKLPPGHHIVGYHEVELFPEHLYRLKHDLFIDYNNGKRDVVYSWIEDVYSGETLWCDRR